MSFLRLLVALLGLVAVASWAMAEEPNPLVGPGAASAPTAQPTHPSSPAISTATAPGNPQDGRRVFQTCALCHSMTPDRNLVGPSLAGLLGRKAGSEPGFDYSLPMRNANIVWDDRSLNAYLAAPQAVIPGNRMPFPGLKSAQDRADVIAFLKASAEGATAAAAAPAPAAPAIAPQMNPEVQYTLRSGIAEGRMVFIGVGGEIDGQVNPVLRATVGETLQVTLINGEGAEHDVTFPAQNVKSARVIDVGASSTIAFRVERAGDFLYYCSLPGHREAGMEGRFVISPQPPSGGVAEATVVHDPALVPPPLGTRAPQTVAVHLEAVELTARLAEGITFTYWTFNRTVPGPFLRVRVGDTVEVQLKNAPDSTMSHSVDFHAALGPGGGAVGLQAAPGESKSIRFKALVPGLYVYHCATPMVAEHIANGMYGLILVEPEEGLPAVDHEFYVMQGEIYTAAPYGKQGRQEFSVEKLLEEHPEYLVFNGAVGALTKLHPLRAKVGERVRIYFGNAGPNYTSSFHVIGEILDHVYPLGGLSTPPLRGLQTVTVPAGGAVIVDMRTYEPGTYVLVDHALARMERGLVGYLRVEGTPDPAVFNPGTEKQESQVKPTKGSER